MKLLSIKSSTFRYTYKSFLVILILCILINFITNDLYKKTVVGCKYNLNRLNISLESEEFRRMNLGNNLDKIYEAAGDYDINAFELLATLMIVSDYNLENINFENLSKNFYIKTRNNIVRQHSKEFFELVKAYSYILQDIKVFPVPISENQNRKWVEYVDSWGYERTYGGVRTHEGTDIMAQENVKSVYPVVSATDGVISNMGWLEKGGYRIGITSTTGGYFYYAHFDSYSPDIYKGKSIKAGELLGYMGNTGYSKVEGTKDKFDVHLHFGIYLYENDTEISINPYYILKYSENKILCYTY